MSDSAEIEALVLRAAQGDGAAQSALLQRYWPLLRVALRQQRRPGAQAMRRVADTDDALQQAALRILRALPQHVWQGQRALVTWLQAVAQAQLLDDGRHAAAQRRAPAQQLPLEALEVPGDELFLWARVPGLETYVEGQERRTQLAALLQRLTEQQRGALLLHHAGYTHAEVGEALGLTAEAARKIIARAQARLTVLVEKLSG